MHNPCRALAVDNATVFTAIISITEQSIVASWWICPKVRGLCPMDLDRAVAEKNFRHILVQGSIAHWDCESHYNQRLIFNRNTIVKKLAFLFLSLWLCGCVTDSPAVHRDDTGKVRSLGEARAQKDFACASAKAGRPVRSVRMSDWGEPLFTEYRTFVEGCGKHVTYVIACRDDDDCAFSDTLSIYP